MIARALLAATLLVAGCTAGLPRAPDLGGLYDRAAQFDDATRNPVIVIPGILGSKLRDRESGRLVWGAFEGTYANPRSADGARLVALPMKLGEPLDALRDDVRPDGVLDTVRIRLFGLPVEQSAYVHILRSLGVGGYRDASLGRAGSVRYADDHFTCFQFAYDWRRSNAENARRLGEFIAEKRAYVARELERRWGIRREIRFDVVAHSMGGLLLRSYLMYGGAPLPDDGSLPEVTWAGARDVENAVVVATPNAGSAESVRNLTRGAAFSWVLPRYPAALLGTMPALYELLPRTRHGAVVDASGEAIDLYDVEEWRRRGWGLASPAADELLETLLPDVGSVEERRRIALDHLAKSLARAKQLHAALDRPASLPPGLALHLYAGDAVETAAVLEAGPGGELDVRARGPGDGTVLRSSTLLDERVGREWTPRLVTPIPWTTVTFVYGDHLELTRDPAFTDNVLYRLLESPAPR